MDNKMRFIKMEKLDGLLRLHQAKDKITEKFLKMALECGDRFCMVYCGLTKEEWETMSSQKNEEDKIIGLSEELNNCDCSVGHINSLPLDSNSRLHCLEKLRKIIKYYVPNVYKE